MMVEGDGPGSCAGGRTWSEESQIARSLCRFPRLTGNVGIRSHRDKVARSPHHGPQKSHSGNSRCHRLLSPIRQAVPGRGTTPGGPGVPLIRLLIKDLAPEPQRSRWSMESDKLDAPGISPIIRFFDTWRGVRYCSPP